MDSDDLSLPYRFQVQLEVFMQMAKVDVVGGNITEFVGDPENITGERIVQLTDSEIKRDMKKRCAMNHVSVMYKKTSVLNAGGYQDWYCNEDYYLWIRMQENDYRFANVPYVLVNVRTGEDMSSRRGGLKYFRSECGLQTYMLRHRMIGLIRYLYNVIIRFVGECVIPNVLRQKLFRFFRKEYVPDTESIGMMKPQESADAYPAFSVAMSVYKNDNPEWFDKAMESIINQTIKPSEIVLVVDGPVPEGIMNVIHKYEAVCS